MAKRSCTKGYGCGGSCISITYMCKKEFPEGVSVSIDGARKVVKNDLPPSETPKKKKGIPDGKPRNISYEGAKEQKKDFDKDPKKYAKELKKLFPEAKIYGAKDEFYSSLTIETPIKDGKGETHMVKFDAKTDNSNVYENREKSPITISFMVNDSFDSSDIDRTGALAIGKTIKNNFNALIAMTPEGSNFNQTAYSDDGKGESRARAYAKNGFQMKPVDEKMAGRAQYSHEGYAQKRGTQLIPRDIDKRPIKSRSIFDDDFEIDDLFSEVTEVTDADFYQMWSGEKLDGESM